MRLFGTYLVALALVALLGVFVWGWYHGGRAIPDAAFAGLLGLVGTLVGYAWLRDRDREREREPGRGREREPGRGRERDVGDG